MYVEIDSAMVNLDLDGTIVFQLVMPDAECVEVIGAFEGYDERTYPMLRGPGGEWRLTIDPGPGEYLFRYRVDGRIWMLDEQAHGICEAADGVEKSRVWLPPLRLDPDSLAA